MTRRLNLSEEQVGFLLGAKPDSHPVRHVFDDLRKVDAVSRSSRKEDTEPEDEPETAKEEPAKEVEKPVEKEEPAPEKQKSLFEF